MTILSMILAWGLADDCLAERFIILDEDQKIVSDARQRLSKKFHRPQEMDNLTIVVLHAFDERCVYFFTKPNALGPHFIICYKKGSDDFTRADVDGE